MPWIFASYFITQKPVVAYVALPGTGMKLVGQSMGGVRDIVEDVSLMPYDVPLVLVAVSAKVVPFDV